ncbi:MAG TPA: RidA family protein [Candidatus Micrarchaeia archaeon]|nr:RidA family protein [Candidatus Micrarchaeia archaeon]
MTDTEPARPAPDATPRERLRRLGLQLPPVPVPRGRYRPWRRSGTLVVTAGLISADAAGVRGGRVGADLDLAAAAAAARVAALALLAVLEEAAGGLDHVAQLLLVQGFVRSAAGFTEQPQVVDAASELLGAVLGEAGLHARVAIGAAELPLGAAVELQAWAEVG